MEGCKQAPYNDKTNMVFMTIADIEGQLFTDQTGHFLSPPIVDIITLSFFYVVDANYIKWYLIKSRHHTKLLQAYTDVYHYLPQLHKLNNETSKDVEDFIMDNNAKLQYTPPDIHQTNPAKQTIHTWKNYFVAIRAGTPKPIGCPTGAKTLNKLTSPST
ncbi:hypothetical protein ACHAW6_006598 [Cyclotella cf. meneghiniana]